MLALNHLRRFRNRLLGRMDVQYYRNRGCTIGSNVWIGPEVRLDPEFCWLINVGDNVTFAPRVTVLAHDASLQRLLGATKYQPVVIKPNCFVGAGSIILPGVTVGEGSIIAAGSVVRTDVPDYTLVAGNPAQFAGRVEEFARRQAAKIEGEPRYDAAKYRTHGFTPAEKAKINDEIKGSRGWCVDSDQFPGEFLP